MTEQIVRPRRRFIFSPDLKPEMLPRALASGTDIVCVEEWYHFNLPALPRIEPEFRHNSQFQM
jgi:hypothetical protein